MLSPRGDDAEQNAMGILSQAPPPVVQAALIEFDIPFTGILYLPELEGFCLVGNVFCDSQKRFQDGRLIRTSTVQEFVESSGYLREAPIIYLPVQNAFDMGLFFDGFDDREGSTAAVHCRRKICDGLARASRGAFQAIEEIAAARLIDFASQWDAAEFGRQRAEALWSLLGDNMARNLAQATPPANLYEFDARRQAAWDALVATGDAQDGSEVIGHERGHPLARTFRGELLNDAKRALIDLSCGRTESLVQACQHARQRLSHTGRSPNKRVVSTPLLLKGLEFDHVLIPDATHFQTERFACAKLFYVAISRARHSLTIASSNPVLHFPKPIL